MFYSTLFSISLHQSKRCLGENAEGGRGLSPMSGKGSPSCKGSLLRFIIYTTFFFSLFFLVLLDSRPNQSENGFKNVVLTAFLSYELFIFLGLLWVVPKVIIYCWPNLDYEISYHLQNKLITTRVIMWDRPMNCSLFF